MKKVYVKASCRFDVEGNVRPLQITWADGRLTGFSIPAAALIHPMTASATPS